MPSSPAYCTIFSPKGKAPIQKTLIHSILKEGRVFSGWF